MRSTKRHLVLWIDEKLPSPLKLNLFYWERQLLSYFYSSCICLFILNMNYFKSAYYFWCYSTPCAASYAINTWCTLICHSCYFTNPYSCPWKCCQPQENAANHSAENTINIATITKFMIQSSELFLNPAAFQRLCLSELFGVFSLGRCRNGIVLSVLTIMMFTLKG